MVADIRRAEPELSVIYRWNKRLRRFLRYQTLETHAAQDWEAFQIQNHSFLVVANHRRGEKEVNSVEMRLVSLMILVFCKLRDAGTSEPRQCFFFSSVFVCNQTAEVRSCGQDEGDEDQLLLTQRFDVGDLWFPADNT